MLDLGKQYGTYRGISFYGDHEDEGLVYYLPNEVKLAKDKNSHYEMDLMLFSEGNIVSKEAINFDDTAGAILQMGVICTVEERTLNRALDELKRNVDTLPENIRVMQPTWKEGTVDMIILDKQKDNQSNENTTGFVKSILGSQKPSFMTNDLKSIFNVRLDRRGSELVYKAIEGSKSSLAGVMYDLKFAALQPTANLRISANLSKCQETVEHELGLSGTYESGSFNVTVGVDVHLLTKKMEENGDIKIEVLSMMESEEDKKRFNQIVDDFKERIIEELFAPVFSEQLPEQTNAPTSGNDTGTNGGSIIKDVVDTVKEAVKNNNQKTEKDGGEKATKDGGEKAPKDGGEEAPKDGDEEAEKDGGEEAEKDGDKKGSSGKGSIELHYSYKKQRIESNKVLTVDYRERATVIKTHNPQSHLWLFGLQLGDKFPDYITKVELGDLWKAQNIHAVLDQDAFETGLKFAEVAFWKKEYGVNKTKSDSEFAIPDGTSPLVAMLTKESPEMDISWTREDKNEAGYYYQVRFGYTDQEIVSEPLLSYSGNLIIIPELCIFSRKLHLMGYGINYKEIRNVDVRLDITDPAGTRPPQYLLLSEDHNEDTLIVRSRYRDKTSIQMTRTIDLNNGTKISSESSVFGSEIPVYNPMLSRNLTLVFSGVSEKINSVLMDVSVKSALFDGELKYRFVFSDFSALVIQAPINVLDEQDVVSYTLNAITTEGDVIPMEGGVATGSAIPIKLGGVVASDKPRRMTIEWDGKSPESADIKRVEVYITEAGKDELKYEFKGDRVPEPVELKIDIDADVNVRIVKRFNDGTKDIQDNVPVRDGRIVVHCP